MRNWVGDKSTVQAIRAERFDNVGQLSNVEISDGKTNCLGSWLGSLQRLPDLACGLY